MVNTQDCSNKKSATTNVSDLEPLKKSSRTDLGETGNAIVVAADAHNHHTHASQHHHHHHHHHNHNFNQSTTKSLPLQTGSDKTHNATHLHVPSSKAQKLLVSATTHAQLPTELPQEDEERLEKLFKQLDRDGNGRIDIHDLSEALREFGLSSVYAELLE
uniref:EF-hand domain-containing protein n=1 Tax=Glossina brevipalpis TaxID=37001 RepID=A0A1A9WRC5_9MUSC